MQTKRYSLICACILACTSVVNAQESSQFKQVDDLIKAIEGVGKKNTGNDVGSVPNQNGVNSPVIEVSRLENKVTFVEDVIKPEVNASASTGQEQKPAQASASPQLNVRFTEMPPYTTFKFNRKVFIPAYKAGVILTNGVASYNIDEKDKLTQLFSSLGDNEPACALLSSRSYVMMSNATDTKKATELNVKSVEIQAFNANKAADNTYIAVVHFDEKVAANSDNNVNISLACLIPKELGADIHGYRLTNLNDSLNGLFSIELPRFIEL